MVSSTKVCPIVGTTNDVLPPNHPNFNMDEPGLVCPVTKATTDHHHNLHKHPPVPMSPDHDANQCPVLEKIVSRPEQKAMDEAICPVVGSVSTVLPPNHPSTANAKEGDVCPITNATFSHHKDVVHQHPNLEDAPKGAVCPVVGAVAGKE